MCNKFLISPNEYLNTSIQAFYNSDYLGGRSRHDIEGTIENVICTLKNDITPFEDSDLQGCTQQLGNILSKDFPNILQHTKLKNLTVCVVPRAKANYNQNQLLFKSTILEVVSGLSEFNDGTNFITRHADTRTTHRNKSGHGGSGDQPYPGITKETCSISNDVKDTNILLIDDLYTESINIDEDAIQALLDKGARKVFFYAIGKTVKTV